MGVDGAVAAVVLAGGASRRMGTDKRLLPIDEVPMLRRTLDRVAAWPTFVVIDPRDRSDLGPMPSQAAVIADTRPGEGPLAALEAGLAVATAPTVLVVAADMPWLEPAVLRLLVASLEAADDAAVACLDDGATPRPLPLAVRRAPVEARVARLLDRGERRLRALLDDALVLTSSRWQPLDPGMGTLRDVDTRADLAAAGPAR